ncbi:MAG: elongation factor G [Oscillospiraceae bacterium]|jgi:elongation factor G|nr:elongation factor G [Oscillospiraceae bacterium]
MKTYKSADIRNIALAGHGGSGKTSLAEALIFKSKGSDRQGKVSDGTSLTDYDPEEIKRRISINTSLAFAEWRGIKINIVDTPGQFDFIGGMYEGIRAVESVVITLTAKDGVQVGTIKAYKEAKKFGKSILFAVTRMEEENADFYKTLGQLKEHFGGGVAPLMIPDSKGRYVNLALGKAYTYDKQGNETESDAGDELAAYRATLCESVATTDDALLDRFFETDGTDFTEVEIFDALKIGVANGAVAPVVALNADPIKGVDLLLESIIALLPSPDKKPSEKAGKDIIAVDEKKPLSAFVFKTIADPFVGKLSFVKIITGTLNAKTEPVNSRTGETERFGKLLALRGKKQEDITSASAGDIIAITKLNANTNDTLCDPSKVIAFEPIEFPYPCYYQAVSAKGKGDEGKISTAISRLLEEDLSLKYEQNNETHQRVLIGLGEQHLDVTVAKMKNKFGVEVELSDPIIAYRETIRKKVSVEGKHKKQSGGHGQYGHVKVEFEPHEGNELIFEERVFGGSVPKNFFPAVEKGLQEAIVHGALAGYPVVRLKATLFDGSYHPVDSSEQAFKMAAHIAYNEGLKKASPCLLEPIVTLKILVNDGSTGDVMGILNKRRGSVLGMTPQGDGMTEIAAEIPRAETADFSTVIRQMTHGMGSYTMEFARYEQLPQILEADVIAKAPKFNRAEE